MTEQKFDFDDMLISPASITTITSRKEINILTDLNKLPLFTAPMDTVVNATNEKLFKDLKINVCLPRGVKSKYDSFESFSLSDVIALIDEKKELPCKLLIDIANGHMSLLMDTAKKIMEDYNVELMIGNIANPETFKFIMEQNLADYVRIGIGNGAGCLTTQQTGIGYPLASLILECYSIKQNHIINNGKACNVKLVADGGFKKYSDIIKALSLGADYVMLGSMFNKALESCAPTYKKERQKQLLDEQVVYLNTEDAVKCFDVDIPLFKAFRGMSTKIVQQEWGKDIIKTSEGIVTTNKVEYTLNGWLTNFKDYLRSAMSYTNASNLFDFKFNSKFILISQNSLNRFKK